MLTLDMFVYVCMCTLYIFLYVYIYDLCHVSIGITAVSSPFSRINRNTDITSHYYLSLFQAKRIWHYGTLVVLFKSLLEYKLSIQVSSDPGSTQIYALLLSLAQSKVHMSEDGLWSVVLIMPR